MKTSSRRLEDVFRLRLHRTFSRRLQDVLIKMNILALLTCLQKMSSRLLQVVLIKTDIFVLVIRLQDVFITSTWRSETSCQDVFKMSLKRLQDLLQKRLDNIFKTSSRSFEDVFKTLSRHLQDVLQRSLQDAFKTYHQVVLFLLTCFQDVFKKYSQRFWSALQSRFST